MKEMAEFKLRFARVYSMATSPTRGKQMQSVLAIDPTMNAEAAKKLGHRLAKDPEVEAHIQRLFASSATMEATTNEEFIARCKTQESMLLARGLPGDAAAAVRYAALIGKAAGMFVIRHEDVTPIERKGFLTQAQRVEELKMAMSKYAELDKPNPTAAMLPPGAHVPPIDVTDYTIEDPGADVEAPPTSSSGEAVLGESGLPAPATDDASAADQEGEAADAV